MPSNSIKINGNWEFIVGDSQMKGLIGHLKAVCSGESCEGKETPIAPEIAANMETLPTMGRGE